MTVRPVHQRSSGSRLRVLRGRARDRRPALTPWIVMVLVVIVGFLGLGFARTGLDKSAFELAELDRAVGAQLALNQELRLEIARLENPARIAPLADEMGLVLPAETNQLLVNLRHPEPIVASGDDGANQ